MVDLESLLGTNPHRFDDGTDDADCVSRLTIAGADGVPRTYEARAGDHATARQQACVLAASHRRAGSQLLLPMPMPWSNATSSAPPGLDGGLGDGMPVPPQDTAAPSAVMPVAMPCLTPLGMSLSLSHRRVGSYSFQRLGQPALLSTSSNMQRSKQHLTQTQQPEKPPPASQLGIQEVGAGDTGTAPVQPLFRIDRKPSRVDDIISSPNEASPCQEHERTSEDLGMACAGGKLSYQQRSSVNFRDPGVQGTPRCGAASGSGTESGVTVPESKLNRSSHEVHHGCTPRTGISSPSEIPPWMGPSFVRTGGPDVYNCASGFKMHKTTAGAFEMVPAAPPVIALHTNTEMTKRASIEAGHDSDGEDDYPSTYNELCQRGVANLTVPKYTYVDLSSGNVNSEWECCATIAATPPGGESPITITKTVRGRNKRDARRVAAKSFLSELVKRKIISRATVDTKEIVGNSAARFTPCSSVSLERESKVTAKQVAEAAEAVSILNQLWQKERFDGKPKWTFTPASSGATGHWKCTILIRTKQFGDVSAECTQSQKKLARHFVAYCVVQKLRRLGFPGIDNVNVQPRQQSNVVLSVADDSDEGSKSAPQSMKALDDAAKSKLDSAGHASGEVADFPKDCRVDSGFGAFFQVPSTVKTFLARNVGDVNQWIAENVSDGAALGLCLDSKDLRRALEGEAKNCHVDVESAAFRSDECRAIALSTEKSAILVAASLLESCEGADWIPKSIKFMLERNECAKYGFGLEEGAIVLRYSHDIHCANLNNLSSSSHALKEDWHVTQGKAITASRLVSECVNQRLSPFSNVCLESVTGLAEAVKSTEHVIAPVITLAVVCSMIRSGQRHEVEIRRRKVGNDCTELSNRLWSPLGPAKPRFKMRRRLTR